ncbi:unnamed protein product [Fraxinus pennsylvanica]|uniref:23 kDa subunit of oxygen evolving system of photosystem II n=1 Tax=Fraxinus pennsylvanica TaxID=56036 RepID=A0AAD1YQ63_9LAMI|nr:unnamed protein product [Fraxinus pennsylvanica]
MSSTACFLHHHAGAALSTQNRSSSSNCYLPSLKPTQLICRAQNQAALQVEDGTDTVSRRLVLTVLIGAAAIGSTVSPADAACGESGNTQISYFVFVIITKYVVVLIPTYGKPKTNTDFLPYNGVGFKLSIPSKWKPSKEVEYPCQVLRYEDNFDSTSNVVVLVTPTGKKSITDYGSLEDFLSKVDSLLGKQAYFGWIDSNAVATANILESSTLVIGGKPYYFTSVLTRTDDGDEGGKHTVLFHISID